jgi:hypothetical protein
MRDENALHGFLGMLLRPSASVSFLQLAPASTRMPPFSDPMNDAFPLDDENSG